jgi:SAM-dependent methyltransferase
MTNLVCEQQIQHPVDRSLPLRQPANHNEAKADNSYNEMPYLSLPMAQTHPDRLASVAKLFGMSPAPIASCRVLEIGCGNGGNLIPMAHFLPGSSFTGIDLAERPIAEGRRLAAELKLANINLIAMDLCNAGPEMGEFDYIIAHGVYSWVPDAVRDGLLAVCRDRLSPQGVALISYNALPGCHVRTIFRNMLLDHTRNTADPAERLNQARALLTMMRDSKLAPVSFQPIVEEEIGRMLSSDPNYLFHDDLSAINDAFYVRDFVARAAGHNLQFVGDAEMHLMFDIRNVLDWVGGDPIEREQYFDYFNFRRFRQTILCRREVVLRRPARSEQMDHFLFSSPARQLENQIEGAHNVRIDDPPPVIASIAAALRAAYPLAVPFDHLLVQAPNRNALREILFALVRSGFAEVHVHDFTARNPVGMRPKISRLARWEWERGGPVTYSNHSAVTLDAIVHELMGLMDGTRDLDAIVSALLSKGVTKPEEDLRTRLPRILRHMAAQGLLEP